MAGNPPEFPQHTPDAPPVGLRQASGETSRMDVVDIEVAGDRTGGSSCAAGFLKLRRLRLRNVYADGSRSAPYPCDVMSRTHVDAVAIVLFEIDGSRRVRVLLKEGIRPAVYLRRDK